jgi:hypothetical protein
MVHTNRKLYVVFPREKIRFQARGRPNFGTTEISKFGFGFGIENFNFGRTNVVFAQNSIRDIR